MRYLIVIIALVAVAAAADHNAAAGDQAPVDHNAATDATWRDAHEHYQQEEFKTAGEIFAEFQRQHPEHTKAPMALFMAAQSNIKAFDAQQIDAREAAATVVMLDTLITLYPDAKEVRPLAFYWKGDLCAKLKDFKGAYQSFKQLTWHYPESKEAKMARGRLTDASYEHMAEDEN